MGPVLRKKEAEERKMLPIAARTMHPPIDSLGITAQHMRQSLEDTQMTVREAILTTRLAAKRDPWHLENMPSRFARLVEAALS